MGRSLELTRPMLKVTTWITDEVRERYERSGAWTDETWWDRLTEVAEAYGFVLTQMGESPSPASGRGSG